jgi:cytochrome oxidase Cu insertion factor (SCO1/SenC/PrrC family)
MRFFLSLFAITGLAAASLSQPPAKDRPMKDRPVKDADFAKAKPAVGDTLPDLTVYSPDGKEVKTSELRGHYTVLVFGCLT